MPTGAQVIAKERKDLMDLMDTEPFRIPRREVDENLLIATWNVVPFGNVLYKEPGQPKNAARAAISDHLPLWAEFRINELTQELSQIINPK